MSDDIEYRKITKVSLQLATEMETLYRLAGWLSWGESGSFIPHAVAGSMVVIGAFDGSHLVGMGRAISDGVSDAYIQDIVVDLAYRRRGIGSEIIRHIVSSLQEQGVDWIALVGEPGTESFYKSLGFTRKSDYIFWKLEASAGVSVSPIKPNSPK